MINFHNLQIDVVKLKFVPFALKDNAKRWTYSLPINSILVGMILLKSYGENISQWQN